MSQLFFMQQSTLRYQEIFFIINRDIGRKRNDKHRPSSPTFLIDNSSFMYLHQFMNKIQSDSHAISRKTVLQIVLEKLFTFFFRYSHPCINHADNKLMNCFIHLNRKINLSTGRSILKCIGKQIVNYLVQLLFIQKHLIRRNRRKKTEIHSFRFSHFLKIQVYFVQKSNDICFFQRKHRLLFLHFPEFKQLINKS